MKCTVGTSGGVICWCSTIYAPHRIYKFPLHSQKSEWQIPWNNQIVSHHSEHCIGSKSKSLIDSWEEFSKGENTHVDRHSTNMCYISLLLRVRSCLGLLDLAIQCTVWLCNSTVQHWAVYCVSTKLGCEKKRILRLLHQIELHKSWMRLQRTNDAICM